MRICICVLVCLFTRLRFCTPSMTFSGVDAVAMSLMSSEARRRKPRTPRLAATHSSILVLSFESGNSDLLASSRLVVGDVLWVSSHVSISFRSNTWGWLCWCVRVYVRVCVFVCGCVGGRVC